MSWGSGAAEGAGNASSAAGSAGSAAGSTASSMPSSVSGYSTQPASGFSIDSTAAANNGQTAGGYTPSEGIPNVTNTPQGAIAQSKIDEANQATYNSEGMTGPKEPTFFDRAGESIERFQKGQGQSFKDTKFGNNAETYGYLYDKANKLSGLAKGGGGGAVPITINNTNQQPVNPYLQARLRRY